MASGLSQLRRYRPGFGQDGGKQGVGVAGKVGDVFSYFPALDFKSLTREAFGVWLS